MKRASVSLLVTATALGAVGCSIDQILLEEGTLSSLAVRVYVDANGNGTFDAEDVPIASVMVTAQGERADFTAPTDGTGLASFQLPPGSYTLSVSEGAPAGAVLATASSPTVVASFQGGGLSAEFRYSFFPGALSGVVYRDDNGDGMFDIADDTPAAGVELTLFSASDEAVGMDITDTGGAFSISALRPGAYTVEITPFAGLTFPGGTSQTVTVGAQTPTTFNIEFEGDPTPTDIAVARTMDGETLLVEGVITWQQEWDPTVYFFQDATAGISVFDTNDPTLQRGDRVRVRGVISSFGGETQVSPVLNITVLGQEAVPTPRTVTAAQVNAGQFQGELVRTTGTVDSVPVLNSFDTHMVFVTDDFGNTVTAFVDSRNGIASADWTVGSSVAVTGVLGTDDRNSLPFRIEIRDTADMAELSPPITIAAARAMPGSDVTVQGVVTFLAPDRDPNTRFYYFQDGTGGITTFDGSRPALQVGDVVRVQGSVGAFQGETQVSVSSVHVVGQAAVPTPRAVTAAEINAGQFQGELVTIAGTVDSIQVLRFDNHNVFFTDGLGVTFSVFVDSRIGLGSADWTVGEMFQMTGVLTTDDRDALPRRIEMRSPSDRAMGVVITTIAAARGMMGTVTVEGVVTFTAPDRDLNTRFYYFQDATGGITTFDGSRPALQRGDRVRVQGDVGAFRGEIQISVASVEVVGQEAVPTPRAVTAAEINAGEHQGELVTIAGAVDSLQVFNFDNHNVFFTDGAGETFAAYVDSRIGLGSADWMVGEMVQVVGVLTTDDRDALPTRIELRDPLDRQRTGP